MTSEKQREVSYGELAISNINRYGIPKLALQAAIEDGLVEIHRSTALDAKTDPGSRAWGAVIRGLRRELLAESPDWAYSYVNGLNLTHNKIKGLNVIVMSGDKYTGLPDVNPKSKNPKGGATEILVGENYDLFSSDNVVQSIQVKQNNIDSTITCVLLYFFDYSKKEARYELSIPVGMSNSAGKAKISDWRERNIFPAIPFSSTVVSYEEEFTEMPEFKVVRK